MRPGGLRLRIVLIVLLILLGGLGAYWGGMALWGAWLYRAAEEAVRRRDFAEAERRVQKCLDFAPDDLKARLLAARLARRQGAYAEARRHLAVYREQGGPAEMLALEQKLWDVQQGTLDPVANLLSSCEQHPEAVETPWILEAVIDGCQAGLDAASAAHAQTPPPEYLDAGQAAVELWLRTEADPASQVQGLVWHARLLLIRGDGLGGLADLREALTIAPEHFEARYRLALALEQLEPTAAAEQLEILRQRDPEDPRVLLSLAAVRRSLGQLDEARELLDRLVASHPDQASALLARGELALDAQRAEEAETWLLPRPGPAAR